MKILAYKGISVISRIIRFQTRSEYSHIAVQLPDETVVEAWHKGGVVHAADFREYHTPGTPVDVFLVLDDYDPKAVENFLLSQVGKGYDYKSVLRFVTRRSAPLNDKWFCNELTEVSFQKAGCSLLRGNPSEHSPRDTILSPKLHYLETWCT